MSFRAVKSTKMHHRSAAECLKWGQKHKHWISIFSPSGVSKITGMPSLVMKNLHWNRFFRNAKTKSEIYVIRALIGQVELYPPFYLWNIFFILKKKVFIQNIFFKTHFYTVCIQFGSFLKKMLWTTTYSKYFTDPQRHIIQVYLKLTKCMRQHT